MARVLVHALPRLLSPLPTPTGTCPGCLRPNQTLEPPWSGSRPIPVPQAGNIPYRPNPALRRGPPHTRCGGHRSPQYFLAQSPKVDYELLLGNTHRNSLGGILPPPDPPLDIPTAEIGGAQGGMLPT